MTIDLAPYGDCIRVRLLSHAGLWLMPRTFAVLPVRDAPALAEELGLSTDDCYRDDEGVSLLVLRECDVVPQTALADDVRRLTRLFSEPQRRQREYALRWLERAVAWETTK
jgi:hypothetical protein